MGKALNDHEILIFQHVRSLLESSEGPVDIYQVAEKLAGQIPDCDPDELAKQIAVHVMAAGGSAIWQKQISDKVPPEMSDPDAEPVALRYARSL